MTRSIHEGARDLARALSQEDEWVTSRRERKKVEMLFAHLKRILRLDRLRLRGPSGARDEFHLAAAAQNLRKLAKVSLRDGSLHHPVVGKHGATTVLMSPAAAGTGVIAGGPMRAVFEVMGITDVVAKAIGSTNPYNLVRATIKGLMAMSTPAEIAAKRGKTVQEILEA